MNEGADVAPIDASPSIFQSTLPLEAKLERARMEPLDLSARNRLLNIPRSSRNVRTIEVIDEKSSEVFRLLVRENRAFTFAAGRASKGEGAADAGGDSEEILDLAQPDDSVNHHGVLNRHADTKLQTRLTSAGLQKRLLDLYADARTLEEEQGVNILFLALGTLKWIDPSNADNIRYAPLVLVPVSLERGSAAERFKLKWRQEEQAPNLSLEAYLDRVHALKLPHFEAGDEFDPAAYMAAVSEVVSLKVGWAVMADDIVLGFFSFAKFLMYRDLDPEVWPPEGKLTELPLIRSLLVDGFPHREGMIPDDASIDSLISPAEMRHIVDSDSSQTLAVHDAQHGHSLVIQGPPGTGKSQTIANIIAAAIADGKTVLFVAEKMAALDVVKRRLDQAGVGDACLELHSNKANKRLLLEELRRTWELGSPRGDFANSLNASLLEARDALNAHVARMHQVHSPSGLTPYRAIGELVRLRKDGRPPTDLRLEQPEAWSREERKDREKLLGELSQRLADTGCPMEHAWWCVGLDSILPMQVDRIMLRVADLKSRLDVIAVEQSDLAAILELGRPGAFSDFNAVVTRARRIATAPELLGKSLAAPEWEECRERIAEILGAGLDHARLVRELAGALVPVAWTAAISETRLKFGGLPASFGPGAFARASRLRILLRQLTAAAEQLRGLLSLPGDSETTASIDRTLEIGKHVAAAPAASPEAFTAAVWDHGVEQAGDLVEAVTALEDARAKIGNRLSDAAWGVGCVAVRQALASHGTSIFRFLSGEWRRANRLVKSVLKNPNASLTEILPLLDNLAKGQNAQVLIQGGDALGRSAFGAHWRGERSSSAPLRALVEWSRSLGPRSQEIRSIASRINDSSEIGVSASCLQTIWDECRPLLDAAWNDFGGTELGAFAPAQSVEAVSLSLIVQRSTEVSEADTFCREIMTAVPPLLTDRLLTLDRLGSGQNAARVIAESVQLGKVCFGAAWSGTQSQWPDLRSAAEWIDANPDIRTIAARLPDRREVAARAESDELRLSAFLQDTENVFSDLRLDKTKLFGVQDVSSLFANRLGARFDQWLANAEQLSKWVAYCERAGRGRALGLGQLIDQLEDKRLSPADTAFVFEQAYYEALLADQIQAEPMLARFDGNVHGRLARDFADLDRQRIAAARLEVVRAHHRRIPQAGGGIGPLGVLRAEIAKRRGHMPIRQLMLKAAPAIQALKPVVMMSPLSVAQFLPPGQLTFDLLVMDEASQIQPVDALGAIARCRQVVVVGDERQLPPTKFFAKMTGGQPDDDDGEVSQVADIESILGLFTARGLPQRMLRWHYRSRHQSLIAVSNTQFYENKLFIVPSPYTQEAGMGLSFHHVPEGTFDSGNSRTNAVEARVVAEAVIRHAKEDPDRSLGVATFSAKQRRAILDQLELLRRGNPDTESYFHAHPSEPFFVKNLENVQGDERDVIFISVGYGRNAQGYMAMAFGPLSSEGGERRLNVLISRAKRRCEVFASITDEDIDLERGKGKGVFAFKLFLHYARTGRLSMARTTERDHDSVFEIQVANALQERGYQVHAQVGIAGFFIDLAIADPTRPGRYLLGIECDGASYHSARSARDRDRLRQSVLEDHGWIIHRIWSTDWFQRPSEQLQLAAAAIEAAKAELDSRGEGGVVRKRAVPVQVVVIDRAATTEIGLVPTEESSAPTALYIEAAPARPEGGFDLHETPVGILAEIVEQIVRVEGPVHVDEVTARVRSAWDLQRSGGRIQSSVEGAISQAVQAGRLEIQNQFLSVPGANAKVRDRSGVACTGLRRPDMLPPQEVKEGVLHVVRMNLGGSQDEIAQSVVHLLGFKATSAQLREVVQSAISTLVQEEILVQRGELLVLKDFEGAGN
jgi:very-short-patch-repair endonuclease